MDSIVPSVLRPQRSRFGLAIVVLVGLLAALAIAVCRHPFRYGADTPEGRATIAAQRTMVAERATEDAEASKLAMATWYSLPGLAGTATAVAPWRTAQANERPLQRATNAADFATRNAAIINARSTEVALIMRDHAATLRSMPTMTAWPYPGPLGGGPTQRESLATRMAEVDMRRAACGTQEARAWETEEARLRGMYEAQLTVMAQPAAVSPTARTTGAAIPHRGHERLTIGAAGSGGQARYSDESASHLAEYVDAIANQIPYRPSGEAAPASSVGADGGEKALEGAEAPVVGREPSSELSRLATVSGSPPVFTTTFVVEPGPAVGTSFTLAVTTTLLPGSDMLEDGQTRIIGDLMVEIPVGAAVVASSPPADEITVPDVDRGAASYSVIWRECEWQADLPTSVRIKLRGESQIRPTQLRVTYLEAATGFVWFDWVWMSIGVPARPGRLSDPMAPTP